MCKLRHSRDSLHLPVFLLFQVKLLEGQGLPTHWVCNMASRAPAILGRDPESELQPVLDYVQAQGITGKGVTLLELIVQLGLQVKLALRDQEADCLDA